MPEAGPDIENRCAGCVRCSHLQHIHILLCFPMISKNINPMIILLWYQYHNKKRCTYSCMGKLTHKSGIAILGSCFSKAKEAAHRSNVCKKMPSGMLYGKFYTRCLIPSETQNIFIVGFGNDWICDIKDHMISNMLKGRFALNEKEFMISILLSLLIMWIFLLIFSSFSFQVRKRKKYSDFFCRGGVPPLIMNKLL